MAELTAESTFREWCDDYIYGQINKSQTKTYYYVQRKLAEKHLYPKIGNQVLKELGYSDYLNTLKTIKAKGQGENTIERLWAIIKGTIIVAINTAQIERPTILNIKLKNVLLEIEEESDSTSTEQINNVLLTDFDYTADFIITRRTSLLSFFLYLHNDNNRRGNHFISTYFIKIICHNIKDEILNKPISEINRYDINGICYSIRHSGLCINYTKNILELIRFGFSYAYSNGLIEDRFYNSFHIPNYLHQSEFHYTDEEYKSIKREINSSELKNLYLLVESLGLTRNEVLLLKSQSFNKEKGTLIIERRVLRKNYLNCELYSADKYYNIKTREVKLPEIAIEALANELEKREIKKRLAGNEWNNPNDYIFTDQFGNNVTINVLVYDTLRIKNLSGVNNFNLSGLRKNTIYKMRRNNLTDTEIEYYLGVKKIDSMQESGRCTLKSQYWRNGVV